MKLLRFVFLPNGGKVNVTGQTYSVAGHRLVITDNSAKLLSVSPEDLLFDFQAADLLSLYHDVADLITPTALVPAHSPLLHEVAVNDEISRVIRLLSNSPAALLRFIYVYCLGHNRQYFSQLLQHYVAGNCAFLEFLEENCLNPWPVSRFAQEFNMPLRKFNLLFQEKFGVTAKQWLLARRLEHAFNLIKNTDMRILDIAFECGFGNHAHFTGSFRKHYKCSPSAIRYTTESTEFSQQPARNIGSLEQLSNSVAFNFG